ncbi:dimethyladenosine transferase 2, mitochondrial [Apis laboriosa]|uniref:dimethyladenosine transferase 2, mitochondrial n=1 Tax=Apis laboriosa TaxID=183418 RepID=UPI001CC5264B|nr:dimethyladenosine transferase 2, mitochondrial [Apis laboriosa]
MINGRVIFYFALPPSIWHKLIYRNKGSLVTYIMFNTLFNYKIFGTLDNKGFLSYQRKKKLKKNYKNKEIDDFFYVVKLEPKPDIFTLFGEKEHIINFWHFVRHNFYKPSSRIIPTLEKIIPGCGIRLIKEKNYNIFTEFCQLNVNEVFNLYMDFKSWPEFKQSSFLSSVNDIKISFDPFAND